jgi:putative ABC transport system permease protein
MIWKNRFGGLAPSKDEIEREVDDEVRLHLEMRAKDFERGGLDPSTARASAKHRFGDVERYRGEMMLIKNEHVQREERANYLVELLQDIRFGFRQVINKPLLPAFIIFLLALGIGVNAAIFSVVKKVLLEPLPFEAPSEIVMVWASDENWWRVPVSGPDFLDWRRENRSFEWLVAHSPFTPNLQGDGEPEAVHGTYTTAGLFELLRVSPALGRTFLREEEQPGRNDVAIISDGLWRRRLHADPDMVGRSILLDGKSRTVVGIMPPGFKHPCPWSVGEPTDVWVPLPSSELQTQRDAYSLLVLGRLRSGVTLEMAQGDMDAITAGLAERYPDTNKGIGATVIDAREDLTMWVGGQLIFLFGAAGLVLLIVCGNVAGLLVAKATTRETEVAIRSSLGASRARLIRQLVTESLPLFLIGGLASLLLADWTIDALRTGIPADIYRVHEIAMDRAVLAFTFVIALATGLVFGLLSALATTRADVSESLKQGRGSVGSGRTRLRNGLVVAQFALTLVLANGAALMLKSYLQLMNQAHGFSTEGVLTMQLNLQGPRYEEPNQVHRFYDVVLERIEALPGVRRAAAISRLPLEGGTNGPILVEGREDAVPSVEVRVITPGYHEAMGIPLLRGRRLTERDGAMSQPNVIINQAMAERIWPDEDPIGKRFGFENRYDALTVVGVVGNTRQRGLERAVRAEVYFPYVAEPPSGMFAFNSVRYLVIRTDVEPTSLIEPVRRTVYAVDDGQPISDIRTPQEIIHQSMARRRFNTILIGIFASLASILVAAGIYGVMAYFVSQRSHEIGVRIAMGAQRAGVLALVLRQSLRLATIGIAVGVVGVLATTKLT